MFAGSTEEEKKRNFALLLLLSSLSQLSLFLVRFSVRLFFLTLAAQGSSERALEDPLSSLLCKQQPWHRTRNAPTVRGEEKKGVVFDGHRWRRRRCFQASKSALAGDTCFLPISPFKHPDAKQMISCVSWKGELWNRMRASRPN